MLRQAVGRGAVREVPLLPSVGGNLNLGGGAVDGSVNVGGNLAVTGPLTLLNSSGPSELRVGGTLTNQEGNFIFLGNSTCFGPGSSPCPAGPLHPQVPFTSGPSTSADTFVNRGTIFSWSDVHASNLTNDGTFSQIAGGIDVGTLKNEGTMYLTNSCCSFEINPTAALDYSHLDEVLSGFTNGKIVYGTWFSGPGCCATPDGYPVDLSGVSLHVALQNGFAPSIGQTFTIMTFLPGRLSGTFSQVSWDTFDNGRGFFLVSYDNAGGDVSITAEVRSVPEPPTISLAALAFGLLLWATSKSRSSSRSWN